MNQEHQKKQTLLKYGIMGIVILFICAFATYTVLEHLNKSNSTTAKFQRVANLPLDGIDPKEIWVDQLRTENEVVNSKVDFIQDLFVKRLQEEEGEKKTNQTEIAALKNELNLLREEVKLKQTVAFENNSENLRKTFYQEFKATQAKPQELSFDPFQTPILEESFSSVPFSPLASVTCVEPTNLHHVNHTIPTGTTVKAILLSSVDMPCGVNTSADPLPVKLRIIADGRLPNQVRARLKQGVITASVYGDLSSERVYFRLEKLAQVRKDGYFIETEVAGYVSGEDGKYGMRGTVVDKSAFLVEQALLSGFLGGTSSLFEAFAAARLNTFSPCNGTNFNPNFGQTVGQLGIAGTTGGVTNALDMLTDYFIKRAEQLRPIIQITAGRIVDITFSESADLGDLYTHEKVRSQGKPLCNY